MPTVISQNSKAEVETLLRNLPKILTGKVHDRFGIAEGFRSRIAWAFFSLVFPAFNEKGRGGTDSAGESWEPLTENYLAYQRGTTGPNPPRAGGLEPLGRDSFMSRAQFNQWWKDYGQALAWLAQRGDLSSAKNQAAAIAWNKYKQRGGRTKKMVFGSRKPGADYQTLVDHGTLRQSLTVGLLVDGGSNRATYVAPVNQIHRSGPASVVLGSSVPYAVYHHLGKGKRERRFWPRKLPSDWWREILTVARGGLLRIGELAAGGQL